MNFKLYALSFLIATLFTSTSFAQVISTIDDGGTVVSVEAPIHSGDEFSYSQTIYLASEFPANVQGVPTTINKISLFNQSGHVDGTDDWTILIGQTSKNKFDEVWDWVPYADLEEVFDGAVTANGVGWMEIELITGFEWDGVSNIVVGIHDKSSGYSGPSIEWGVMAVSDWRVLTNHSDFLFQVDIENPTATNFWTHIVPKIKFDHTLQAGCEVETFTGPFNMVVDHSTICEDETIHAGFENYTYTNLVYQWQKLDGTTWVDLANGNQATYQGSFIETTDIRVKAICLASSEEILTEVETITVNHPPHVTDLLVDHQASGVTVFSVENPEGNYSYKWNFGDGTILINDSSTMIYNYGAKGEFTVTVVVSNDNECGDVTLTQTVNVNAVVGLSDENNEELLSIYPNPSSDFVTIELRNTTQLNVVILDVNGKIVSDLGEINSTVNLDVSNWSKGIFFAHISNINKTEVVKLVIQ